MGSYSAYQIYACTTNTLVFIALIVAFLLFEAVLSPFHRGFFCDDESIQKPYTKKQVVSTTMLVVLTTVIAAAVIIICDVFNYLRSRGIQNDLAADLDPVLVLSVANMKKWKYRILSRLLLALIGALMCTIVTGIGKVMVGRLRPHFLAVCKPDYTKFNCSDGYITIDVCTNTDTKVLNEARLSFPSGHSSISAYTAVFTLLYIEYVVISKKLLLLKPFVQLTVLCLGIACSLTRISDYFHHWSDVLAGLILGILSASYTIYGLMKLPSAETKLRQARACNHIKNDIENQSSFSPIDANVSKSYNSINDGKK